MNLVDTFRRDLATPRLPVVLVRLADAPARHQDEGRYPGWGIVQDAQASVRMGCVKVVEADGLLKIADDLHLSTAAQRRLGPRLAAAMRQLRHRCR